MKQTAKEISDELEERLSETRNIFSAIEQEEQEAADNFWNNLSYEDKCNAFHAVVERLYHGEIENDTSYRYILYNIFGFGPDMYIRGMNCGYIELHNSICNKCNRERKKINE